MTDWRIPLVGIYTTADHEAEQYIIGFALLGGSAPPSVKFQHFEDPWLRAVFLACLECKRLRGKVHPVGVARQMRKWGRWLGGDDVAEVGRLLDLAAHALRPDFAGFVARSEKRLAVLRAERQAERLRREIAA